MKILSPFVHGVLDYAVVLAFALAPAVVGLSGTPRYLSFTLSGVHLALTLATDFPAGVIKVVPMKIHSAIELVVGPVLIAAPWLLGFSGDGGAYGFYQAAGAIIFVTWVITDYSDGSKAVASQS